MIESKHGAIRPYFRWGTGVLALHSTLAFYPSLRASRPSYFATAPLRDIREWRDIDFPPSSAVSDAGLLPRRLGVFPFDLSDALVVGQSKDLHLYEPRFHQLFDAAMEDHAGMVGMGLIAPSGIVSTVPLAQIETYTRLEAGIFATIRVVGRCSIVDLLDNFGKDGVPRPYLLVECTERADRIEAADVEKMDLTADAIENGFLELSRLEHKLGRETGGDVEKRGPPSVDANEEYHAAKTLALEASEHEGFVVRGEGAWVAKEEGDTRRSLHTLTAISWAALSTSGGKCGDKLMALDCEDLLERLHMALGILKERKKEVVAKLALAGLSLEDNENEEEN